MTIKLWGILLISVVFSLVSSETFAETIYLHDGRVLQEKIVERTDQYIMTKSGMVMKKYYHAQIEHIEEDPQPIEEAPAEANTDHGTIGDVSQDKAQLIDTFIDVSGVRRNIHQNIDQVIASAPQDQQEELRELFNVDEILERMVSVYDKYYTEEDLNAIIAFYQSPTGLKVLEATPQIMQEAVMVSVEYLKDKTTP